LYYTHFGFCLAHTDIIETALQIPREELGNVVAKYEELYKTSIFTDMDTEFNGPIKRMMVGILTPLLEYDIVCLHEAMVCIDSLSVNVFLEGNIFVSLERIRV
jgi:hypothetical protein